MEHGQRPMAKEYVPRRRRGILGGIIVLLSFFLLSFSSSLWAAARQLSGVMLPEQSDSKQYDPRLEKTFGNIESDKIHLIGEGRNEGIEALRTREASAAVPEKTKPQDVKKLPGGLTSREDYALTEKGPDQGPYLENDDVKFYHEYANLGNKFLAFNYIYDHYKYEKGIKEGGHVVFKSLDSFFAKPKKVSAAQLTLGQNLHWKFFEPFWGMNFGVSYLRGKGLFVHKIDDEKISRTVFSLWVIPVEVFLGTSINLNSWIKLGGMAGPSVIWLSQNRNDLQADHPRKRVNQLGYGFFAQGYLKLGLGRWFPGIMRSLYNGYQMTNFYLQPMVRYQHFENFKEDLKMSGLSFGAGFAFDFRGAEGKADETAVQSFKDNVDCGNKFFTLSYIFDNYTYELDNKNITDLYTKAHQSKKKLGLQFTYGKNLDLNFLKSWNFLKIFWGGNIGLGHLKGQGIFHPPAPHDDETDFSQWVVPIEAFAGLSINLATWFKLGGMVGPSIVFLKQNHDSYQEDNPAKNLKQVGWGYFAQGYLKLGLGRLFPGTTRKLFKTDGVTNFYLQPFVRYQSFDHFRRKIKSSVQKRSKIGGTSFGLGVAFDFL